MVDSQGWTSCYLAYQTKDPVSAQMNAVHIFCVKYNNSLTWNKATFGINLLTNHHYSEVAVRSQWGHYNLSRSIHTLLGVVMVMKKCTKAINVASSSVECALWWPFPKVFSTTTTWFSSKYLGVWPQPKRRTYKPKYNWTFSALSWNIFSSSFLVN